MVCDSKYIESLEWKSLRKILVYSEKCIGVRQIMYLQCGNGRVLTSCCI